LAIGLIVSEPGNVENQGLLLGRRCALRLGCWCWLCAFVSIGLALAVLPKHLGNVLASFFGARARRHVHTLGVRVSSVLRVRIGVVMNNRTICGLF